MSGKKLTRREFLGLSTVAGAGVVLAASGAAGALAVTQAVAPTDAPATTLATGLAAAASAVDLRFVWWGGQQRSDVTTQVIKMFEAKHPNLKFAFEPLGSDDSWTQLPIRTARVSNIPEVLQTHRLIDGTMYGLGANATGFVADLDAFKKAGIEVPAAWAWADFGTTVNQLHTKLNIWGFGMFLNHKLLSLMSLGECSCESCLAKQRQDLNLIPRQPTMLQQYF